MWDYVHAKCWFRNSMVYMYIHQNILLCAVTSMFIKHQCTSESWLITSWDGGDIDKLPALCEAVTKAAQFKQQHFISYLVDLVDLGRHRTHLVQCLPHRSHLSHPPLLLMWNNWILWCFPKFIWPVIEVQPSEPVSQFERKKHTAKELRKYMWSSL